MRKTFLYMMGGQLATIAIPVVAQDSMSPTIPPPELGGEGEITPDNVAQVQTWPIERQEAYSQWPQGTQAYFWTLTEERQEWFWQLQDTDKLTLVAMDDTAREEAWAMIEERMNALGNDASTDPASPTDPAGDPVPGDDDRAAAGTDPTDPAMPREPMPDTPDGSDPDSIPR